MYKPEGALLLSSKEHCQARRKLIQKILTNGIHCTMEKF